MIIWFPRVLKAIVPRFSNTTAVSFRRQPGNMDYFGYQIMGKSPDIDATRRLALDRHANIAQLSQLLFIVTIPMIKIAIEVLSPFFRHDQARENDVQGKQSSRDKSSGSDKPLRRSYLGHPTSAVLCREVMKGCGTYEQWICGLGWSAWLALLCFRDTAPGEQMMLCWLTFPD